MTSKIVGVKHTEENLKALLELIDRKVKEKKGKFKLGVEPVEKDWQNRGFWNKVIKHAKKHEHVKVVFLDNPTGDRIAFRTYLETQRFARPAVGLELPSLSPQKHEALLKGKYVATVLRDKSMARRIEKAKPDLSVLGAFHAFGVGKVLKVKPEYIGCTGAEVKGIVERHEAAFWGIKREKKWRKEKRREKFKPKKPR